MRVVHGPAAVSEDQLPHWFVQLQHGGGARLSISLGEVGEFLLPGAQLVYSTTARLAILICSEVDICRPHIACSVAAFVQNVACCHVLCGLVLHDGTGNVRMEGELTVRTDYCKYSEGSASSGVRVVYAGRASSSVFRRIWLTLQEHAAKLWGIAHQHLLQQL